MSAIEPRSVDESTFPAAISRRSLVISVIASRARTSGLHQTGDEFEALANRFKTAETAVNGVSPDAVPVLDKFRVKYGLTFPLLSDVNKTTLQAYGVWTEKSMYGRKYMGVERTTFLIGKDGSIARIWPK